MNIFIYVIIAGIIQGLILGFYFIISKRGNVKANRILGLLIILISVSISHSVLYPLGIYNDHPHLLLINQPLLFLFGPLFLFYERTLVSRNFVLEKTKYFHFIPFIVCIAFLSPFYIKHGNAKLLFFAGRSSLILIDLTRFIYAPQLIQILIYLFKINSELKNYHNKILKSYSSLERINLNWLRLVVFLFTAVYGVIIFLLVITLNGYEGFVNSYGNGIIGVLVSLCVYIIGYRGLFQPEIFVSNENDESEKKRSSPNDSTNFGMESNETYDEEKLKNLLEYMQEKKPYLKEDLTLPELASQMGVPRNQLSALINEGIGENFFMFINKYRVEEVKQQLANPEKNNYTILAIAFEAGFRSKSSFHNTFKKVTGLTPLEYRNSRVLD